MMDVMIPTGAGQIGMAIARRMGYGMKIVIGDKRMENAVQITDTMSKLLWSSIIGYLVIYPCFYVGRSIVSLQKHDGGGVRKAFSFNQGIGCRSLSSALRSLRKRARCMLSLAGRSIILSSWWNKL